MRQNDKTIIIFIINIVLCKDKLQQNKKKLRGRIICLGCILITCQFMGQIPVFLYVLVIFPFILQLLIRTRKQHNPLMGKPTFTELRYCMYNNNVEERT